MEALGFPHRAEAMLHTLTEDVLKSSEIEGEFLDRPQVRSSIARRLGTEAAGLSPADRQVDGVVEMMLDATQHYTKPLTQERLFAWHASLFAAGSSSLSPITVGAWRTGRSGPMRVVFGPIGRETVHFEAPDASRLNHEMQRFLHWYEGSDPLDPVLKAGLAHLWFVTIHPFDDGNGRIARAIGDQMLARSERSPQRFYSLSAQIRRERPAYYRILESTQKGNLDISPFLAWFLDCLGRAIDGAEGGMGGVLKKTAFWERQGQNTLNLRQRLMLGRLLDGFEGKLTSSKWAKLAKCSQDTALRDIDTLVSQGILAKDAPRGRSTSYSLVDWDSR